MESWSSEQLGRFDRDGFIVLEEGFIHADTVALLRERFEPLFAGRYETGIRPDEVNWVPGRDPEDRTRQICNGWGSAHYARFPLRQLVGVVGKST